MELHLGKFIHSKRGRLIMSVLLGFGLASLFRNICKNKDCLRFYAPPLKEIKDKIYKKNDKCVKYKYVATKCDYRNRIVPFDEK